MPTLRSKDKGAVVEAKEASPLLKWMKGGAKKGDAEKEPEVKQEVKPKTEEKGEEDEDEVEEEPKVKELKSRKQKAEKEGDDDDDENTEVLDEEEEEQDEYNQKKIGATKVKRDVKPKSKRAAKPKSKVNKRKQQKRESSEEEEGAEEEGAEEWKPEKKIETTRLKIDIEPKKEDLDDDVQNQEDIEAQQDEDAIDGMDGDADFNEYERQRQENILKNKLLLQQLQLDSIALGTKPKPKPKPSHKSAPRKKKESSVSTTEHVPRRQSSRIAGLPADSEKAKRRYEEESAALEQAERAKRMRVSGDVTFDVRGIDFSVKGDRYARTFTDEDVKNTENMDVKKLREKMMGLKIYERWMPNDIKITPERAYYLGFHPTSDKQLIFAGDKMGTLGVWDASSSKPSPDAEEDDDEELPAISEFKIHPRTISSFAFSPFSMNTILTASYDSSIRSFDLAKGLSTEVYVGEDEEGISGVEIHDDNPYLIYFSTLEGRMGRKDTRYNGKADVWQLSDKKIGGFSMHPKQTHLCVTASLDRTIKLWDLRKIISGHKDGEGNYVGPKPAMIGEHTSRLSVSSAYWNHNGSIATTSYDDTVKIYRFSSAGSWVTGAKIPAADCGGNVDGEVEPGTVIRHNNQTGRWVTILRAQWQQNPRDGADKLVIGNMNRFLDIYAEDGTQLAQLGDDSLTAVPATAQFHPTENWVAGGTASGKVVLFS